MDVHQSDSLTFILTRIAKRHRSRVHQVLQARGYEVYPGQPPLLRHVAEHDGLPQRELAHKLQIAPATLTVMLQRMEKTGLVERRADSRDQRVSRVYLTEAGREAHAAVKEALRQIETEIFADFTAEEKQLLRGMLLRLYEAIIATEEPNPPTST